KVEAEQYKLIILDAMSQLYKLCPLSVVKEAMQSPSEALRKKAAEVIGIVQPENAVNLIRPLIGDSLGRVRAAAAAALGSIGGEEVYLVLKEMQEKDPDWQVKSTCQNFISSWENAIQDRVAFDEVDRWLAENTENDTEEAEKINA
ncbi:MAG: HEAT repeat domain-containing protein, partial [Bacillota bacterium]